MRASILLVGLVSALGAAVAAAPSGGTSKALLQRRQTADNDKELEELEAEEAEWQRERKEYVESSTGTCWKEYLKEGISLISCLKEVQKRYRTLPIVKRKMLPEIESDVMEDYIKCREQGRTKSDCEEEAGIEVEVENENGETETKVIKPKKGFYMETPSPPSAKKSPQLQRSPSPSSTGLFGLRAPSLKGPSLKAPSFSDVAAVGGSLAAGAAAFGPKLAEGAGQVLGWGSRMFGASSY